ncbi:hypothetical protein EVAR_28772_1 [Eumeta japonica]|uniref:Uncharacterized protein n=1 Tax=Eumeta variegata TaxID=151549 RepID=A0A4C1VFX8_EUMVA|nr:hypothetical protein EVAR_28772_1 [Eumeta japonica]
MTYPSEPARVNDQEGATPGLESKTLIASRARRQMVGQVLCYCLVLYTRTGTCNQSVCSNRKSGFAVKIALKTATPLVEPIVFRAEKFSSGEHTAWKGLSLGGVTSWPRSQGVRTSGPYVMEIGMSIFIGGWAIAETNDIHVFLHSGLPS